MAEVRIYFPSRYRWLMMNSKTHQVAFSNQRSNMFEAAGDRMQVTEPSTEGAIMSASTEAVFAKAVQEGQIFVFIPTRNERHDCVPSSFHMHDL